MADILTSKIQVPSLPDDTLILKDAEARNDLSTALATATGNPLNFSTRSAQKAVETEISLEPIQDLHGYDYPWPAGGGKSKIDLSTAVRSRCTVSESGDTYTFTISGSYYPRAFVDLSSLKNAGDFYVSFEMGGTSARKLVRIEESPNGTTVQTLARNDTTSVSHVKLVDVSSYTEPVLAIYVDNTDGGVIGNTLTLTKFIISSGANDDYEPYKNICPIDGRTETSLVGCGKNQLDKADYSASANSTWLNVNCNLSAGTYTFSFKSSTTSGQCTFNVYDLNEDRIYQAPNSIQLASTTTHTFTISSAGARVSSYINVASNISEVMIEKGSTKTDFSHYTPSNNLTIQFGEKVYGAKVELEKGTVTVDRAIVTFDGTQQPTDIGVSSTVCRAFYTVVGVKTTQDMSSIDYEVLSDYLPQSSNNATLSGAQGVHRRANGTEQICVSLGTFGSNLGIDNATKFNQFLSDNNLQVCYPLATPRTIQLTPNEISLLMGVNNISTNGDSISLTYRDGKVATLGDLDGLNVALNDALDGKVDEVSGKGLSTNDYTNEEKAKVAEIDAKADDDGSYGDMAVGSLLMSNAVKSTDTTPFLFRPIPPISTPYIREKLVGASMAWNQLVANGNFASTTGWTVANGTLTVSGNIGTFTMSGTSTAARIEQNLSILANHVYMFFASITPSVTTTIQTNFGAKNVSGETETKISVVSKPSSNDTVFRLYVNVGGRLASNDTVKFKNIIITDLTLAFGTAIANRIYSMEQAQAGSGIAWIKSYGFLTDDYYANDVGSIQSVCVDRKEIVGKNLFDIHNFAENYQVVESSKVGRLAIQLEPNTNYTVSTDLPIVVSDNIRVANCFAWSGLIDSSTPNTSNNGVSDEQSRTVTTDNNGFLTISLYFSNENTTNTILYTKVLDKTYFVKLELGVTATPYIKTTISLGHDELRGVMQLDANNNLVHYGDEKTSDGVINRKFGIVDLGTLEWSKNEKFYANISNMKARSTGLCSKFKIVTNSGTFEVTEDTIALRHNNDGYNIYFWYVSGGSYSSMDTATFKTAMSGVYLVYELATPTTEQSTPFTSPQYLFNGGTEEFIDYGVEQETRDVAVPVGHVTEYMGAGEDKVFFPTLPSADGEYIPHIKVQGGVIIDFWFESVVEDGD